jgi:DNA-binding HxlR family transcriptional regulator
MSRSYSPDAMATPRDPSCEPRENEPALHRDEEGQDQGRSGGAENQPRPSTPQEVRKPEARTVEPRKPYEYRNRTYALRGSEIQTMTDIGKFRAVDAKDLREFCHGGNSKHLDADLTNLRRQGLIARREIPHQETARRQLVALTKQGHRLLVATNNTAKDQALYHGFTKPREAHHDADLYRLYQRGLEKITREGGTRIRVILDSELKKNLYRDLARAEQKGNSGDAKAEIAERHGLRVVRGKIPVPDLRIEYETPDQEHTRVDLELATEHYRFRNIAQKVRAGFSIYARAQDASNLRRVLDQHELTAEILNL